MRRKICINPLEIKPDITRRRCQPEYAIAAQQKRSSAIIVNCTAFETWICSPRRCIRCKSDIIVQIPKYKP